MSAMPSLAIFVLYHMLQVTTIAIKEHLRLPITFLFCICLGIWPISRLMLVFRSLIVSGWLPKTLSLKYPQKKKSGGLRSGG